MRRQISPLQIIPSSRNVAGPLLLVKKYQRPEKWHGLHLPQGYLEDPSWSLWEVVVSTSAADEEVGATLHEGDIFKTRQQLPIDSGCNDNRDDRPLFFMPAKAVQHVVYFNEE